MSTHTEYLIRITLPDGRQAWTDPQDATEATAGKRALRKAHQAGAALVRPDDDGDPSDEWYAADARLAKAERDIAAATDLDGLVAAGCTVDVIWRKVDGNTGEIVDTNHQPPADPEVDQ